MCRIRFFLCCALATFLLAGTKPATAKEKGEWNRKMSELLQALNETVPDLFSEDAKGEVTPAFRSKVKKIYDLSRDINQDSEHALKAPDDDPGLAFVSRMFREEMDRAYQSLDNGPSDYAKSILKSSVSYCIACHTRSQSGPQFPLLSSFQKSMEKASWVDRVAFKAATRQFDEAFTEVLARLEPGAAIQGVSTQDKLDIERASQIALMIAVRVKESPEKAQVLAEKVGKSKLVSESIRIASQSWLEDIRKWRTENAGTVKSDRDLMKAAHDILSRAALDEVARSNGTEVRFLRASNLMHRLLRDYPKSNLVPEALFLVGASYDALSDVGVWNLADMYFQACVHRAPHSAQAEKCFRRYEDRTVMGFSGSSGTHIPGAVATHLKQLKDLAMRPKK